MNRIARMGPADRAEIFAETADRKGVSEIIIEKDFWVCWVLQQLFSMPLSDRLLFKGGTSLSKIFHAINRFSEDIDLAVDYAALGFRGDRDPRQETISKTRRTRILEDMMACCRRFIAGEFLTEFRARCIDTLGAENTWSLNLSAQDPNVVLFRYPASAGGRLAYIAPQIVLELGTHAEFVPHGIFPIRAFVTEEFPHLTEARDIPVKALLAKRTFWEKATILHAEYHRPADKPLPGRYSRHYYDVAMLAQTTIRTEALAGIELLADVIRHKTIFYPSAWAHYHLAAPGSLRLVPPPMRLAALRRDYREMEMMIFGEAPDFEAILQRLGHLESSINASKTM